MDGILVIDKPSGKSSHGVVHDVRRFSGAARVGHAGTLDPLATGVLVVCLGAAVRITEYLIDHPKAYRAVVQLGVETDTYDATGRVVATRPVRATPAEITSALQSFTGKLAQTPPAFSAIQVEGVRQYQRARRGEIVELAPREVEIYALHLRWVENDRFEFDVECSKGTYVRSLAHDLGSRLGTGGHLLALRRLASGPFCLEQAITLEAARAAFARGEGAGLLLPLDRGLEAFPALQLDASKAQAIVHGRTVLVGPADGATGHMGLVRVYAPDGRCLALCKRLDDRLAPHKVFYADLN